MLHFCMSKAMAMEVASQTRKARVIEQKYPCMCVERLPGHGSAARRQINPGGCLCDSRPGRTE